MGRLLFWQNFINNSLQCPGNFFREFMDEANKDFVREPLPDIPDSMVWIDLMALWRNMRAIHKSSKDPSDNDIELYKAWVVEFQEKIFSLKWVPVANQIHRLSHLAFFMQSKPIRSIGAYSLEGLEHGNFSTKDGESRRVWKGDSRLGNRQLFRYLRLQSSPLLRRAAAKMEGEKRKQMQCSKCGGIGHSKSSSKCPLIGIAQEQNVEPIADLGELDLGDIDLGDIDLGDLDLGGEESEIHSDNQNTNDSSDDDLDETGVVLEDVIETTIVIDDENTGDLETQCTTS